MAMKLVRPGAPVLLPAHGVQKLVRVERQRRSARTKLTRLRTAVIEFADWYLAPGHHPVAEVREWVDYLRDRAGRR